MEKTVIFRNFEERDIDFVYKCKNDEKLMSLVVGNWHPFSYEEASIWVRNCMKGDRPDLKFWAICTNDDEKKIIGWISLTNIDLHNKSACYHGLVIGDALYRDGTAEIEAYLMILEYAFEVLNLNRLYGTHLVNHLMTKIMADVMFFYEEGVQRQAIYRQSSFLDLVSVSLLSSEYFQHKAQGDYTYKSIMKRLITEIKIYR